MNKNIVFVFCDQLRHDTIHALGNPIIKTPVLDELVKNGTSFTNAFTPSPVCVPARYCLHTGKMPHETGIFENYPLPDEDENESFMCTLSENGYQTFGAGKMHFAFPTGFTTMWGFDERQNCDESDDMTKNDYYQYMKKEGFGYVQDYKGIASEMYYIPQVSQVPPEHHHSHWVVDKSIEYVQKRDKDRPFFLMTSFEKPHPPFIPPVPWNRLYRGPDMPLPKQGVCNEDVMSLWNHFQNRYKYRDHGIDVNLVRQMKAHYYAEISFVDYNLGRLIESLKDEGVLEETLIIFTADHGEMLGDYNCFGKRCFLDSAAKIPMLLWEPGKTSGEICTKPVSLLDIYPTLMDYAGIPLPDGKSGVSLRRIMTGEEERESIIGQYESKEYAAYMITDERYKYIYSAPDEKEYLFDAKVDPDELQNRAYNPLYMGKTEEMRNKLITYFEEAGYEDAVENGRWRKYGKQSMNRSPDAYLLFQDLPATIPHIPGYETSINQKDSYEFKWLTNHFSGR